MGDIPRWYGRRWASTTILAIGAAGVVAMVAACSPSGTLSGSAQQSAGAGASPTPPPEPFTLAVSPPAGTKDVPLAGEVGIALTGGKITDVTFTKAGSTAKIDGTMRDDGTSWIPAAPLSPNTTYNVAVTGQSADGTQNATQSTSFSTMGNPGRSTGTGLYMFNGQTVGVGMPVVVEFNPPVPEEARAGVQKRLFVTTNPPQPGVWHWASGGQVFYRAPNYWQPGTTITVRAGLKGQPTGNGRYGDQDRSATVTVGQKVVMDVDNATKQMKVYVNDQLAKTVPVSLGKASTPSSSGYMVVMSKDYQTTFDTRGEPNGGYVTDVNYAMRLTWGGEFIHAAPWSVGDQGVRNVSHGCVNMATPNAEWLFSQAHIGDPVIVRGTEVALVNGNGWTAWNLPWSEYVKGSALPVPGDLASVVTTPESVSAVAGAAPQAGSSATPSESGPAGGNAPIPSPSPVG